MFRFRPCCFQGRFNSRSREGSDGRELALADNATSVSIRAPVKGATEKTVQLRRRDKFQFTLP